MGKYAICRASYQLKLKTGGEPGLVPSDHPPDGDYEEDEQCKPLVRQPLQQLLSKQS